MTNAHNLLGKLAELDPPLTPRGKRVADFVLANIRKVVFMTARELSRASGVSESTVVRLVSRLGYDGYGEFIQTVRDMVDADLTISDRIALSDMGGPRAERFKRFVTAELDDMRRLLDSVDLDTVEAVVKCLEGGSDLYFVSSRLSYSFAYYMGWSISRFRSRVTILNGSDLTTLDWLATAPEKSTVVIVATSRYPNELIRVAKLVQRLGHTLIVLCDSAMCPLIHFAHYSLVAPSRHIPLTACPSNLSCLINCLVYELVSQAGESFHKHHERLEQSYREHDILFNLTELSGDTRNLAEIGNTEGRSDRKGR